MDIIKNIRSILMYHKVLGVKAYPRNSDIQAFLSATSSQTSKTSPAPLPGSSGETVKTWTEPTSRLGETVSEIAEEIKTCTSCDLIDKRVFAVPGNGGQRIKLFIIGGWPVISAGSDAGNLLFGREEDSMLERMLHAIHLQNDDVFVTNIIKCGISENVQPTAENISACFSYLHRQIAITSPHVICTMGHVAARTILQVSQPLSQLRGRFHRYKVDEGKSIPLMPTYHPSFLLQNPEMKRATWLDLQLIAKKLAD